MTGAITWEQAAFFLVMFGAVVGLWYRVETRISSGAQVAMVKAEAATYLVQLIKEELASYKLAAAEKYAPMVMVREVEDRIDARFDRVEEKLDKLLVAKGRTSG